MDHHNGLTKWTVKWTTYMDYLKNYPEKKKKNGKKYYPLVVCFGQFIVIRHLVFYFVFITAALKPVVPKNKHVMRMSYGRNMSHVCYTFVAPGVNNLASFLCVNPLLKRICEYHLYGLYHVQMTYICKTP